MVKTDGLPTLAEVRPQPMLHPGCGTNLVMLLLPLILPGFFLSYWLSLLLILPVLSLFFWMKLHPEHPLARRMLALGYAGQRLTLAPPQDRELQAALKALEGLAAADSEGTVAEKSASTTLNQTS